MNEWGFGLLLVTLVALGVGVFVWLRAKKAPPKAAPPSTKQPPEALADSAHRATPHKPWYSQLRWSLGRDKDLLSGIEESLYLSDLSPALCEDFLEQLQPASTEPQAHKKLSTLVEGVLGSHPQKSLYEYLTGHMKEHSASCHAAVLFVGINGSGKTTTIGRVGYKLKNLSPYLVGGDCFRAGAEEQLQIWSERAGLDCYTQHGARASAVVFDALSLCAKQSRLALVDTAGRLHTQEPLMQELVKIKHIAQKLSPTVKVVMVLDATTGQNALTQARRFHQDLSLNGIVLNKMDGCSKGGAVLSLWHELQVPIWALGVGESLTDLVDFDPQKFAKHFLPEPKEHPKLK